MDFLAFEEDEIDHSSPTTDAVPKKRGPKTDVLEALLKRVDGLEAKLKEKKEQPGSPTAESGPATSVAAPVPVTQTTSSESSSSAKLNLGDTIEVKPKPKPSQPVIDTSRVVDMTESVLHTPSPSRSATSRESLARQRNK